MNKDRKVFFRYLRAFLLGVSIGLLALALESVQEIQISPFPCWEQLYLHWRIAPDSLTYNAFLHLRDNYSLLKSQAVGLRFCMLFLDHGFLYTILPALACVMSEQFKNVRAVDCIRKSLGLFGTTILTCGTAGILFLGVLGKLPVEQSFDQVLIFLLKGLQGVIAFSSVCGVLPAFLITSLCVYMANWKTQEQSPT